MHRRDQGGDQQEDQDQNEGRPCAERVSAGKLTLVSGSCRLILRRHRCILSGSRKEDQAAHADDCADDVRKLRTDEHTGQELRNNKGKRCRQRDADHSLQGLHSSAEDDDHDKRGDQEQKALDQCNVRGKDQRINTGHSAERDRRDTHGSVSSRHGVDHKTCDDGAERVKSQGDENTRRDSDRGSEAGHTFHEVAESPAHDQDHDAAVLGDAGKHLLDVLHGAGLKRQLVSKQSSDNDKADGPKCIQDSFQCSCRGIRNRLFPVQRREDCRDKRSNSAGLEARHLESCQSEHQPYDR